MFSRADETLIESIGGVLRVLDWHVAVPPPPPPEFSRLVATVVDQNGDPIPAASVVITTTGDSFTTNTQGQFAFVRRLPAQGECSTIRVSKVQSNQAVQTERTACDEAVGRTPGEIGETAYGTIDLTFVDIVPPQVVIVSPEDGVTALVDPIDPSTLQVLTTVTAVDTQGISVINFDAESDNPPVVHGSESQTLIPPSPTAVLDSSFQIDLSEPPPFAVSVEATALDTSTNQGTDSVVLTVLEAEPDPNDSNAPVVFFLDPVQTLPLTGVLQGSTPQVTFRCIDDVAGCSSLFFQVSGLSVPQSGFIPIAPPSLDFTGTFDFSVPASTPVDTPVTISLFASDNNFNFIGPVSVTVVVIPAVGVTPAFDNDFQPPAGTPNGTFAPCGSAGLAGECTDLGLSDDDVREVTLPGGVLFPFYGTAHPSFFVNTNGNLTFGAGDPFTLNPEFDDFLGPEPRISPFQRDLNNGLGGGIFEKCIPDCVSPRRVTFTWNAVPGFPSGVDNTFQVTLYTDQSPAAGRIDFVYLEMDDNIGIVGLTPGGPDPVTNPGEIPFIRPNYTGQSAFPSPPGNAIAEEFSLFGTPLTWIPLR